MPRVTSIYRWYVLYTRCKHEVAAEKYLTRCGIVSYLPMHRVRTQRSDRMVWLSAPMFRCYIFVRVSCLEYEKALQDFSIAGYVKFNGFPCVVPDEQIQAIKEILNKNVVFEVTSENFVSGMQVIIQSGPLSGYLAEVVDGKGKRNLILRMADVNHSIIISSTCEYLITGKP
jgi:transcription antitermination factor NusG